ncbi:hypothetical protein JNE33_05585 [Streptococcus suis]|uniref:hypothetical protein n=1 Tax=Streptococcus suis TaxID=1307 RepID=UPI00192D5DB6|nr:hypothetical protein [Streptococcus suis]MBL6439983.1 hypothetical protein [Streptococcus suis]HEM3474045.1 hypothetical protein [Streptococcus suis]HEM3505232.1 hypothetical protein [Streptococcus suis]HEM3698070.1 hypothetical protein [Streptococcus suis]
MNKRQKKKRLERKKKEMIKGVDFVEKALNIATEMMRKEFDEMPNGIEKMGHDFFIAGIEYTAKMLGEAKNQIRGIE